MSDEEDDYDDDDYLYLDDGPYDEADDLAEHTMHSPVYQDCDPSLDTAEAWSDWEYYSDDYYDREPSDSKKRNLPAIEKGMNRIVGQVDGRSGLKKKRRKLQSTEAIPELSLGDSIELDNQKPTPPIVIWKPTVDSNQIPVVEEGQGENVTLLKNWRERFKMSEQTTLTVSEPIALQRRTGRTALAVAIEQKSSSGRNKRLGSNTASSKDPAIPSRGKTSKASTNGTVMTASAAAKQRQKVSGDQRSLATARAPQQPASTKFPPKETSTNGQKRKASALTEAPNTTENSGNGAAFNPGKRKPASATENFPPQEQALQKPIPLGPKAKKAGPKTELPNQADASKGTKRKVRDPEEADLEPPWKRKTPGGNATLDTAKNVVPQATRTSVRKKHG